MARLSGTGRLADDLYLMAHHERSGRPHLQPRAVGLGLGGALLAEPMLAGQIRIWPDGFVAADSACGLGSRLSLYLPPGTGRAPAADTNPARWGPGRSGLGQFTREGPTAAVLAVRWRHGHSCDGGPRATNIARPVQARQARA
jgi:Golgi phosphoprotein 3 (GPP34)